MTSVQAPYFEAPRGSAPELYAAAAAFGQLGQQLGGLAQTMSGTARAIPGWEGMARDAFHRAVNQRLAAVAGAAGVASTTGQVLGELAAALDEASRTVASAQADADWLAQQAAANPFPQPTLFFEVNARVHAATSRLDDAKRRAAARFQHLHRAAPGYVPPAPPPSPKKDRNGMWSRIGHGVLDVAGLVPVLGEGFDLANAAWHEAEGDHINAALSAASAVPLLGYGATAAKAGKYTNAAVKAGKTSDAAAKGGKAFDSAPLTPVSPRLGGADGVPPVRRPGDAGYPRRPGDGPGTRGRGPGGGGGGASRDRNPTGFDRTPVGERPDMAEAVRRAHDQRLAAERAAAARRTDAARGARAIDPFYNSRVMDNPAWRGGFADSAAARARADARARYASGARTGDDVNAAHLARGGFAPHDATRAVRDFRTAADETFVRVTWTDQNRTGAFLMRRSEIEGLTPRQIRDRFALPAVPLFHQEVVVPAGTRLRESTARPVAEWGPGGGRQFNLLERIDGGNFGELRPLR